MFIRAKKAKSFTYLQIVENERQEGKVVQRVLLNLGRLDVLQQSGQLDSILLSGIRFSENIAVLDAYKSGEATTTSTKRIGPALLFEKIWRECGIGQSIQRVVTDRRFKFSIERSIFLTVLHRLFAPGSDRAAEKWRRDYAIDGCDKLGLHHLYRAMGWLGHRLADENQKDAMPGMARCIKDEIEEDLFANTRDLFTDLQLVFFDTTSIYFEGLGGVAMGQYGYSKDHRPDLRQIVVGIVLDNTGTPICSEILPGNTTDVKTLVPVAQRLKHRFGIERVCIVADRGMISQETIEQLDKLKWQYILGVRMRRVKEIGEKVLADEHRYHVIHPARQKSSDPSPLKVKEVVYDETRYIVCHNVEQAQKDHHDRQAIVESLREALKQGDKALVGNKGYRRYLTTAKAHFEVDEEKIKDDERFDGMWVLTTNTDLPMDEVALKYKDLWMVEEIFRTMKSTLETRPIYHKCDETITGHVFCSFLALKLRKHLQDRLAARKWKCEWADIITDVNEMINVEVVHRGKSFAIRTETKGVAGKVFQAAGVALPSVIQVKK